MNNAKKPKLFDQGTPIGFDSSLRDARWGAGEAMDALSFIAQGETNRFDDTGMLKIAAEHLEKGAALLDRAARGCRQELVTREQIEQPPEGTYVQDLETCVLEMARDYNRALSALSYVTGELDEAGDSAELLKETEKRGPHDDTWPEYAAELVGEAL